MLSSPDQLTIRASPGLTLTSSSDASSNIKYRPPSVSGVVATVHGEVRRLAAERLVTLKADQRWTWVTLAGTARPKMIGTVVVSAFAVTAAGVPAIAAITATRR